MSSFMKPPIPSRLAVTMLIAVLSSVPATGITIELSFTSGGTANDPFGVQLQRIMRDAADHWEDIIEDEWTLSINYYYSNIDHLGDASILSTSNGKPTQGRIRFDKSTTWFFDPTPKDNSEFKMGRDLYRHLSASQKVEWFRGSPPDLLEVGFTGSASSNEVTSKVDLYSVALHELGHALGMSAGSVAESEVADYDFDPSFLNGAVAAAKIADVPFSGYDASHIGADSTLMYPFQSVATRTLPSAVDAFSVAAAPGWKTINLPRKEFFGDASSPQQWNNAANWIGGRAPDFFSDHVYIQHGGVVVGGEPVAFFGGVRVTVDGNGSSWSHFGSMRVGRLEEAYVNITNGGSISTSGYSLIEGQNSPGTVTVDGTGSEWNITSTLIVGNSGSAGGVLDVIDGASVTVGSDIQVGSNGSTGFVNVSGVGSTLAAESSTIGKGPGYLDITRGGSVSITTDLSVGYDFDGQIKVEGVGSMLSIGGDLILGADSLPSAADGHLIVRNGAKLDMSGANPTIQTWRDSTITIEGSRIDTGLIENSGKLSGTGRIVADLVQNSGRLAPGLLTLDADFTQQADGVLVLKIGGTRPIDYSQLTITGDATFAGELQIEFKDGFLPSPGNYFDLMRVLGVTSGGINMPSQVMLDNGSVLRLQFVDGVLTGWVPLNGDYNGDGIVNVADYTVWRNNLGSSNSIADGNGDGSVDHADYDVWRQNFGATASTQATSAAAVPESSGATVAVLFGTLLAAGCAVHRSSQMGLAPSAAAE